MKHNAGTIYTSNSFLSYFLGRTGVAIAVQNSNIVTVEVKPHVSQAVAREVLMSSCSIRLRHMGTLVCSHCSSQKLSGEQHEQQYSDPACQTERLQWLEGPTVEAETHRPSHQGSWRYKSCLTNSKSRVMPAVMWTGRTTAQMCKLDRIAGHDNLLLNYDGVHVKKEKEKSYV